MAAPVAAAPAAKTRVFTATHGVTLADTGPKGEFLKWAQFTAAPQRQQPNGPMVFEFSTTDAKVADRLAKSGQYGITEVTS